MSPVLSRRKSGVKLAICALLVLFLSSSATWLWFPFQPRSTFEIDAMHIDGFSDDSQAVISHTGPSACHSASGPIRFWNTRTGKPVDSFLDDDTQFACSDLSPDGKSLLLMQSTRQTKWEIWDLPTRTMRSGAAMPESWRIFGYSPDGNLLAHEVPGANFELEAFKVAELDLQTLQVECRQFESETNFRYIVSVVYSPDCSLVALNLRCDPLDVAFHSMELFERESGRRIGRLGQVKVLGFSRDGERLIGLNRDSAERVWLNHWKVDDLGIHEGQTLCHLFDGKNPHCYAEALSPNGTLLAVTRFATAKPGVLQQWYAWLAGKLPPANHSEAEITLIDVASGTTVATLARTGDAHFSPDGQLLATNDDEGVIQIWELPLKRPILPMILSSTIPPALLLLTGWYICVRRKTGSDQLR